MKLKTGHLVLRITENPSGSACVRVARSSPMSRAVRGIHAGGDAPMTDPVCLVRQRRADHRGWCRRGAARSAAGRTTWVDPQSRQPTRRGRTPRRGGPARANGALAPYPIHKRTVVQSARIVHAEPESSLEVSV
jgi:hypothetical protein